MPRGAGRGCVVRPPLFVRLRRVGAAVLLAAVLAVGVVSALCIALAVDHECDGEECPVCELIAVCQANLHQLGTGCTPMPAAAPAAAVVFAALPLLAGRRAVRIVPVALKVRLDL